MLIAFRSPSCRRPRGRRAAAVDAGGCRIKTTRKPCLPPANSISSCRVVRSSRGAPVTLKSSPVAQPSRPAISGAFNVLAVM